MFPVVGNMYSKDDFYHIDLSMTNEALQQINSQTELTEYIDGQTQDAGKSLAYGGYCEERDFYLKSPLFSDDKRTFHLGIDVWLPVGHPVYAASAGQVYGKAYNSQFLDYGYTVIVIYQIDGQTLYALYGHLAAMDFDNIQLGEAVKAGDVIGFIGDESENGGWAPHLHFQLIIDLEGNESDYPGVCHKSKSKKYVKNCPDPISWVITE